MKKTIITAALLLAAAFGASAEDKPMHMHGAMAGQEQAQSPSSQAFAAANARMHKAMDIDYSGNADVDFVRGMIAHHQGAIDMAKVELQYGKDEKLRKLAQDIITAQEGEIAMMKAWLAEHSR
ncbi:CopM family metallochaperone [Rhizobium paknamense]|uniref:Uncharacterized protein (DUF305 family) n=1 Tax=Rhizobium paknamense TaxID=1206817 RepID=A0ABU0I9Q1_9HYPH|nr:DUF305 domain-containing protein [Rhizobium paknamense]MDQ0454965.1 uncharacterized protein (DUF305 family) [Rhizobium paknamense]